MVNTEKLQGRMREKKHTLNSLSKECGISTTTLFNKIHNIHEFKAREIKAISNILDITLPDLNAIFFVSDVEQNSTK